MSKQVSVSRTADGKIMDVTIEESGITLTGHDAARQLSLWSDLYGASLPEDVSQWVEDVLNGMYSKPCSEGGANPSIFGMG